MVHSESMQLGCICPECGQRCKQCLGTNSVVSKENLKQAALGLISDIESSFDEEPEDEEY